MDLFDEDDNADAGDEVPKLDKKNKKKDAKNMNQKLKGKVTGEDSFVINEQFADRFERKQRFDDLQRAKNISLDSDNDDDDVDDDDSESESEDDEAEGLSSTLELKVCIISSFVLLALTFFLCSYLHM
jgi:hypothetical protein